MLKRVRDMFMFEDDDVTTAFWETQYLGQYTPDMAALRFGGPIPVFMYGKYAKFSAVDSILNKPGLVNVEDYKVINYRAETKSKMVYLNNNITPDNPVEYQSFIVPYNMEMVGYELTKYRIAGILYLVSLKALMVLDDFFNNEFDFRRQLIDVNKTIGLKDYMKVHAYGAKCSMFANWDKKSQQWRPKPCTRFSFPVVGNSKEQGDKIWVS